MSLKQVKHYLKRYKQTIVADAELSLVVDDILSKLQIGVEIEQRRGKASECIYIVQLSSGQVEVGLTSGSHKKLKSLSISNHYVTYPLKNAREHEKYLQQLLSTTPEDEKDYLNVITWFEKKCTNAYHDKSFRLTKQYIPPQYSGSIYATNGSTYRSIGSFAKAFAISKDRVKQALEQSTPICGVYIYTTQAASISKSTSLQPQPTSIFTTKIILRKK